MGFKRWFWALGPIDLSKEAPRNEWACEGGGVGRQVHPGTLPGAAPAGVASLPDGLAAWERAGAGCWLAGIQSTPSTATTPSTPPTDQPHQTRSAPETRGDLCNMATWGHFQPRGPTSHAVSGRWSRVERVPVTLAGFNPRRHLQAGTPRSLPSPQVEIQGRAFPVVSAAVAVAKQGLCTQ